MGSFGAVIPVKTLNNGFPGSVTRLGKRGIAAREVLTTGAANPIKFGDAVIMIGDATGGTYQSIPDFITGGGTFTAPLFAGVAVRNVKTSLVYLNYENLALSDVGSYAAGQIAEALEEGSLLVQLQVTGSPIAGGPVYVRVSANGGNTVIGGFEGVSDSTHTVALTGVVFRTGVVDANGVAEITILNRVAA